MNKGIIFNIQKFSIHDGPGIRTTVFLKGCPLRCEWCANPESQLKNIQILWDFKKCAHCLTCVHSCPHNAIEYKDHRIVIDHKKCDGCLKCTAACPTKTLTHEGEYKSVDDVVDVCLQDIDFYEESDGGVTISGGEGMSQPEFLKALVLKLKENHIHTAIETTGFIKKETFQDIASHLDLLLFDVKHYDSLKHQEKTGVKNELIKENLQWAITKGIEVLPRIPVIPDFNETLEDAKGLAQFLLDVGATRVQLLPFHQFGENKYKLLNKPYLYENKKALHAEELKDYQQVFLNAGLDCFF